MTEQERINYIEYLFLIQGDSRESYENMSDEKLKQTYEREWARHENV